MVVERTPVGNEADALRQHAAILTVVRTSRRISQLLNQVLPEFRKALDELSPKVRQAAIDEFSPVSIAAEKFNWFADALLNGQANLEPIGSSADVPPWDQPIVDLPSITFSCAEFRRFLSDAQDRVFEASGTVHLEEVRNEAALFMEAAEKLRMALAGGFHDADELPRKRARFEKWLSTPAGRDWLTGTDADCLMSHGIPF